MQRVERHDWCLRVGHGFDFHNEATLRRFVDVKVGTGEMAWAMDETGGIARGSTG